MRHIYLCREVNDDVPGRGDAVKQWEEAAGRLGSLIKSCGS
jgi:hypothetical protein